MRHNAPASEGASGSDESSAIRRRTSKSNSIARSISLMIVSFLAKATLAVFLAMLAGFLHERHSPHYETYFLRVCGKPDPRLADTCDWVSEFLFAHAEDDRQSASP
jgi:hypothetical protein